MQQLQPNTTLQGGKYRIERVLGQGGFGNTYVGVNTTFDDKVAIKEFFMQGINDRDDATGSVTVSLERNRPQFEEQREKFKKEALRIRKLDNPHIVKVHDLFEENGTVYYVMDYVDGENLAERLKRTGKPMLEQEVRDILPQILDALKSVHDAGIWHLDLKPANILLDKSGNVKLIDFGASKQMNAQKGGATTSTAISYTNGYAPREQMEQNYDKFGPWTDIYALGATLYNLLTNKRPPLPTDIDDDMSEDKHIALPLPDDVSDGMKQMVLWMMKTNRNHRPQNVYELFRFIDNMCGKNKEQRMLEDYNSDDEDTLLVPPINQHTTQMQITEIEQEPSSTLSSKKKEKNIVHKKYIICIFSIASLILLSICGYIGYHKYCINKIRISEILTNNSIVDVYGHRLAWIELENTFSGFVDVGGLYLTSDRSCLDRTMSSHEREKRMVKIGKEIKLGPLCHKRFYCNSIPYLGADYLALKIPKSEPVWIAIYDKTASYLIDSVSIPALAEDHSYRRVDNKWIVTAPKDVTPGTKNVE